MPARLRLLCVASALLVACASNPQRTRHEALRLDTETVGRLRHAAALGRAAAASAAAQVSASQLAALVPILLVLLKSGNAAHELDARLWACARRAERQVNSQHFGDRAPTRAECGEEVMMDGCVEPITRAMLLGQQKHAVALQCAREVLEELWPGPFSIEQRYRYFPNAKVLERVGREEEARLIAQGCTSELWRTIKPDIVLHADRDLLRSVVTLDFKFPCPDTNEPRWTRYGEASAYAGRTQKEVYESALGGPALSISPQKGVMP